MRYAAISWRYASISLREDNFTKGWQKKKQVSFANSVTFRTFARNLRASLLTQPCTLILNT